MEAILQNRDVIVDKSGKKEPTKNLEGKLIGFYFSAHWCPPCRGFTPTLVEFYNKVKSQANGANFEIVFVSLDRDGKSFSDYYATMPWLTVDYEADDLRQALSKHYGVSGIPAFILVDGATGEIKEREGRGKVSQQAAADSFPWGLI